MTFVSRDNRHYFLSFRKIRHFSRVVKEEIMDQVNNMFNEYCKENTKLPQYTFWMYIKDLPQYYI